VGVSVRFVILVLHQTSKILIKIVGVVVIVGPFCWLLGCLRSSHCTVFDWYLCIAIFVCGFHY